VVGGCKTDKGVDCLHKQGCRYSIRDVALHVNDVTYGLLLRARDSLAAAKVERETEARLLAKMKVENEARVYTHRLHIVEHILTLKCPRGGCGRAVLDFNGCFSITCYNCNCAFCGWCFSDCGADAHRHVAGCKDNVKPGDVWGTLEDFNKVHREKRAKALSEYLDAKVMAADRGELLQSLKIDLTQLGITMAMIK